MTIVKKMEKKDVDGSVVFFVKSMCIDNDFAPSISLFELTKGNVDPINDRHYSPTSLNKGKLLYSMVLVSFSHGRLLVLVNVMLK